MTLPSDIHVILPGPQRGVALRRLAAAGAGPRVVVLAETDSPSAVEPWVAPLREGRVDAVYAPRSHGARRLLGPGDGAFALRGAVLAGLDLTEDGDAVGYEVAAQVAAMGGRVIELDGPPGPAVVPLARALAARWRWSAPMVWRRDRLARRRSPKDWDTSDAELASTLHNLDAATNYAEWIVAMMAPHLSGRILEVGAGHGTFTSLLARFGRVTATELSERAIEVLIERYAGVDGVTVVPASELRDSDFDAAVLVNVLEHIDDDVAALRSLRTDLRPGGRVIVYAPAFNALYSRFDAAVGHYRRYTKRSLERAMEDADLEVVEARYVNAPGALAWYVVATRLGRRPTEGWLTRLFDAAVVPVVRGIERRVPPPFGQSVLVVSRRRHDVSR